MYEAFGDALGEGYLKYPWVWSAVPDCDYLERILDVGLGDRLLDVGCGVGRHVNELAARGYRMTGIDVSRGLLRVDERLADEAGVHVKLLHVDLRREGWTVDAKRIYRLYKEEGLVIRPKTPRRKRSCRYRGEREEISTPNLTWAMDFMSDTLFDNRPYRILTVADCHSREKPGGRAASELPRVPCGGGAGPDRPRAREA